MIDKPLNQFNAFFKKAADDSLDGRAQLMYLHLFNKFNQAHWADTVQFSNRDLAAAMNLYESSGKPASVETLYRIRQRLTDKGYIKFTTFKGKDSVEYELLPLYPVETSALNVIDFQQPQKFYPQPSRTVQETWLRCEGELFKGSDAFGLIDLEKLYGVEALCKAIVTASQSNKYPKLTYTFVKKVLENQSRGGSNNGVSSINSRGKYSRIDVCAE